MTEYNAAAEYDRYEDELAERERDSYEGPDSPDEIAEALAVEESEAHQDAYNLARAEMEGYCVLCEREGHTARSCPDRDDDVIDVEEAAPEIEGPSCSCDTHGLYSLGTVESIRAGETDPWCKLHGVEDVRSGAYEAMSPSARRAFDLRLVSGLRDHG